VVRIAGIEAAEQGVVRGRFGTELARSLRRALNRTLFRQAPLFVGPGHFYSPIVAPDEARADLARAASRPPSGEPALDLDAMLALLRRLAVHFPRIAVPDAADGLHRYHAANHMFGTGDALVYGGILREFRPKRLIEVGSGFSSALALDTADETGRPERLVFIEPWPERLHRLLRPADKDRAVIHPCRVQEIDPALFDELEAGDILFLDTTHIAKTGSDVLFEVFDVLPRLRPGVLVHFHDMFADWEYPEAWLGENRSWNELYLVRAFLAFNSAFEILLFSDHLWRHRRDEVLALRPGLTGLGGGLWLRRAG
jgi:hypothetical protein